MRKTTVNIEDHIATRSRFFILGVTIIFLLIIIRLFYWQVLQRSNLQAAAEQQYQQEVVSQGSRGSIYTIDGSVLVTNEKVYRLFAQPHLIADPEATALKLATIVTSHVQVDTNELYHSFLEKIQQPDRKWISLRDNLPEAVHQEVTNLRLPGVGLDPYLRRSYPEASMAAHITGFVGKNEKGEDTGYFGLEGALEKELKSRKVKNTVATDALGLQLLNESDSGGLSLNGRDITTTLRRDVQYLVENALKKGIEQYGAKSGEIVIMDPKTGHILAMASYPSYSQANFNSYPSEHYRNPAITHVYEPGSTFKVLTVAAGIDAGKITPDTRCPSCSGPRRFGTYEIGTWNDKYYPETTMTEGLAHSDNVAMIYIAETLGSQTFQEYIKAFGIGEELHIELQDDTKSPFPQKWGAVELATTSFGQGIGTTSMQLVRAVSTIANQGVMMRPKIVASVKDVHTGETIEMKPVEERRVITEQTARLTTQMMVTAADAGEAQWVKSRTHTVAGKTGTSQIAVNGSYDPDKTVASFIGFAPASDPKFVMLVKLVEPQSSIWAAETATPLWYSIADKLFLMMQIPPDR